jgi:YD repeat-containing protein
MVQTKFDGQNGARFGGDGAWKHRRHYSEEAGRRNQADRRFLRAELESALDNGVDEFTDLGEMDVVFHSGNTLGFFTPDGDTQVHLRYDGSGKLISAHCGYGGEL